MSVPWPDENPDAWNRCELGGLDLPGLAHVKVRLSEELDIKKPKGGHGATITHQGYNPAKVQITLRMWEPDQFAEFQLLVVPLRPRVGTGRDPAPLSIVHPRTALWGIKAVTIQEIDDSGNVERGDVYDVTFDCMEHFPPPKIDATKTDTSTIKTKDNAIRAPDNPPKPSATGAGP